MSGAGDRLRLKRSMGNAFDKREPNRRRFRATIGDGAGNVRVPGKKNHVYMRRVGRSLVEEVLNVEVPARNGMPVICGADSENPDMLQVLAVDWQSIKEAESFTYLPMHHESHELLNPDGGDDVVWVQKTQIVPLAPFPTSPASMQIWVQSDYYPWAAGWNRWPGGLTVDLSTYFPEAYSGVYVLVSIDGATNALQYTAGTEYPYWPPAPEEDAIPAAPSGSVPIVAVYLWARANLLPNDPGLTTDSFETAGGGGPDIWANWTEFVGAGVLANDAVVFYAAGGGLNSCQTTEGGGGRDTGVYQDFLVTAGSCYQLRFWTRDDGGANDGAYRIYDVTNGADIVATTGTGVVGGPTWTEITAEFTAPAGCATARVYFYCPAAGASQAWFDDATVAEVPCSVSWANFRDLRLVNSPMPGSIAPLCDNWIGVDATNTISWQPDTVAVLSAGALTEYADPDDALTAAAAGDVVLVPPGNWVLSAAHVMAVGASICSIGGAPENCVLSAAADVGAGTLLTVQAGYAKGIKVTYTTGALDPNGATAIYLNQSYGENLIGVGITAAGAQNGVGIHVYLGELRNSRGTGQASTGDAVGIKADHATCMVCEGDASTTGAGNAYGIEIAGVDCFLYWCTGYTTGGGIQYGIYASATDGEARHCTFEGVTNDIAIAAMCLLAIYSCQYEDVNDATRLTYFQGDRAGIARDETITGIWTFDEEITQAEQAADPGGPGAGYGRLYPKNDGGQTKYYFQDDAASVYEIQGIVEDLTVTVGGGGDFATIQAAIDYFKNWIIKGACVIDCDAAAYDEAVSFADLLICPGSTLTLEGDTRVLAGITYVDTSVDATDAMNLANLANGGDGICTLSTNIARDEITVAGSVANPDFNADGWVNGDEIKVFADDGVSYDRIIDSISPGGAGNHVIGITVALPAGATLGNDGTAVGLVPNRGIERTAAGRCILVDGVRGVVIDGWYLETSTGADCDGIRVQADGFCTVYNVLGQVEDYCFRSYSLMYTNTGAVSVWDSYCGFWAVNAGQMSVQYCVTVNCPRGYWAQTNAYLNASYTLATTSATMAYYCRELALLYAYKAVARQSAIGYYCYYRGYIYAALTNAGNNGNVADYNPAVSDVFGNSNASITWS